MPRDQFHFAVLAAAFSADPRSAPRLARAAGFSGLQFDVYSSSLNLPDLSASGRREFRHLLAAQDLELASLHVDLGQKGLSPSADFDRILARLDTAMETAAGLACRLVCVELGALPPPPPEAHPVPKVTPEEAGLIIIPTPARAEAPPPPPSPVNPAWVSAVDDVLHELGARADRYGVMLAFRSELSSLAAVERALRAVNCPWFGNDLDPVAILRDEWSHDEAFSRLGQAIRHIRARDALKGEQHRTKPMPIGQGSVQWDEFLENLDESDFTGWITVDPVELSDRSAAAINALQFLKKVNL